MPAPPGIVRALTAAYPKPIVDSEWLEQCCAWLASEKNLSPTDDFRQFMENVTDQFLGSDLRDSMQRGTGLINISRFSGHLQGPPVLVQVMEITEIGVSAFQLEQVRAAREERILAGEGDQEGEEDGDVEVQGEGPMPKFPRGTLHFQLCDGESLFEAMEYRHIPQLMLGGTKLGYKLQLRGTRFSNGMAFLEPTTIKLIGGFSNDLETEQKELFKRSLHERMGKSLPPAPGQGPGPVQVPNYAPGADRAPLRDISPPAPSLHDDDVDMEPRRRVPANSALNQPTVGPLATNGPRPVRGLPSRHRQSLGTIDAQDDDRPPGSQSKSKILTATSSHFSSNGASSSSGSIRKNDNEGLDINFVPTTRQLNPTFPPESFSPGPQQHDNGDSFDFDLLDEMDNDENVPPAQNLNNIDKGKARAVAQQPSKQISQAFDDNSSDYGMDDEHAFANADFLAGLDQVEHAALGGTTHQTAARSQTLASSARPTQSQPHTNNVDDIIEINDSDEEEEADKENAFVPMRHVRRRTQESAVLPRGRSPTASQRRAGGGASQPATSQRKGKPVTLPTNPVDVIDLSDSD